MRVLGKLQSLHAGTVEERVGTDALYAGRNGETGESVVEEGSSADAVDGGLDSHARYVLVTLECTVLYAFYGIRIVVIRNL